MALSVGLGEAADFYLDLDFSTFFKEADVWKLVVKVFFPLNLKHILSVVVYDKTTEFSPFLRIIVKLCSLTGFLDVSSKNKKATFYHSKF